MAPNRKRSGVRFLSQLSECFLNPPQRRLLSQNFQGFKQGRGILSAAYGYADGLKHLSGFKSKLLGGGAQSLIQGVVFEIHLGKNGLCLLERRPRSVPERSCARDRSLATSPAGRGN